MTSTNRGRRRCDLARATLRPTDSLPQQQELPACVRWAACLGPAEHAWACGSFGTTGRWAMWRSTLPQEHLENVLTPFGRHERIVEQVALQHTTERKCA